MKSTGEVMGIDLSFGAAFAKAEIAAENALPTSGQVFVSVKDHDKAALSLIAKQLSEIGFQLIATAGTADYLNRLGLKVKTIKKIQEGRPNIVDALKNKEIQWVINTVGDKLSQTDSREIRHIVLQDSIPYFTTIAGARAAVHGIEAILKGEIQTLPLQQYHA